VRLQSRLTSGKLGVCDLLIFAATMAIAAAPIVRELMPYSGFICGLGHLSNTGLIDAAVHGKIVLTAVLVAAIPFALWRVAGSWHTVLGVPIARSGLTIAATVTAGLTAYDLCTGFHATERGAHGCACWMTAAVAVLGAIVTIVVVFLGREILGWIGATLTTIVKAIVRLSACPPEIAGAWLCEDGRIFRSLVAADRLAARGPPRRACDLLQLSASTRFVTA
jgi:hypothetical protein